ncbi:hypothetical protein AGRI_11732 [Alishewanella agri BL06]|jgi:hypothetical protein|uniref:Excinuclease ATPase subunit n=1 Tax=Alishewanella agri BL06 TaxID=1195246 RepID=I9P0R3_9ALTE|nr:hypothetical protein [Alishewanella agri]EIW88319.1 hypothetical protein AGRI_11732 [Alishewanella agri BL06]
MQIQSAFGAGLQGLQRASNGISEETLNINRQTTLNRQQQQQQVDAAQDQQAQVDATARPQQAAPATDVTQSLVRLEQQELSAQANVRSLRTADEMLGSIIDIRV